MGTIFTLIADSALVAEDSSYYRECQVCDAKDVPVYNCPGYRAHADGTADRAVDVYVACAVCVNQGRVVHLGEAETDAVIDQYARNPAVQKHLLRRTPRIVFLEQEGEWPFCCGMLAEYMGPPSSAAELVRVEETGQLGGSNEDEGDQECQGEIDSLQSQVGLFRCLDCGRWQWVHQPD